MSMTDFTEVENTDVGPVEDDGQVAEGSVEVDDRIFDINEYSDYKVRVKVDGEEQLVPLAELPQGYMRQADYTRKTQTVAEQMREAEFALTLQRALEANPQEALRVLQAAYVAEQQEDSTVEEEYDDPYERMIAEKFALLEQRLSPFEDQYATQMVERELGRLSQQYGTLFEQNKMAVIQKAVEIGSDDLESTFKVMAFDLLNARNQGVQDFQQQQTQAQAERTAAKEAAADVVSGGASANGAGPIQKRTTSVREAYLQSLAELT